MLYFLYFKVKIHNQFEQEAQWLLRKPTVLHSFTQLKVVVTSYPSCMVGLWDARYRSIQAEVGRKVS